MTTMNIEELKAQRLSPNFTLDEFCWHSIVVEQGIDNVPDEEGISRLRRLCQNVLQSIRDYFSAPVHIVRGYISPQLNQVLGGSPETLHQTCSAADFWVSGVKHEDVIDFIEQNLDYDVILLENSSDSPWIYVSYVPENNRRMNLTKPEGQQRYFLSKNFTLWELVRSFNA